MSALDWAPRDGETVHLARFNGFGLPAGRYTLRHESGTAFSVLGNGQTCASGQVELQELERRAILTPISAAELERDRKVLELRTAAPLRGNRHGAMLAQHDAGGLALFRAANEPTLI